MAEDKPIVALPRPLGGLQELSALKLAGIPVAQGGAAFPGFILEFGQSDWNKLPMGHPLNPFTRFPAHQGESDLNVWSDNA